MDTNQTIDFKPVYLHPQTNLYNAPVISETMPNSAIASGLNLVSVAQTITSVGNQESNSFDNLATIQASNSLASSSAAQLEPMTPNSVCLNNNHLQQVSVHQNFRQNHSELLHANSKNITNQLKTANPLSQIQMTTPAISHVNNLNNSISNNSGVNYIVSTTNTSSLRTNPCQTNMNSIATKTSSRPDGISRDGSSIPRSSDSSISSLSAGNSKNSDSIDYIDLAKASCSNSNINMKTLSSSSSFSTDLDVKMMGSSTGRGFKCRVCDRNFTQKGNLKTHLMTHSGERPYECQTCGKNFTQKGNLDTHVKIHTETKDHKCCFCDRGFTQRGNLKTHIRSVHTKEKPYACGHCGKAFSQKGNMLTHFRTHDKDARFPCNVCGKTFSQKGNLKTHQQRHGRRPGR